MEKVLFSNSEYQEALAKLDQLMRQAEQVNDTDHKVLLYNVLQYFDSIHREPLSRLMAEIKKHPELIKKISGDETIQKLSSLYDIELDISPVDNNGTVAFIPVDQVTLLSPRKKKDWLELGNISELENNRLYAKNYEKVNFLISKIDTAVYAVQNQCDGSFLPIDQGTLEEHILICPWHGCKYDLKTGESLASDNKKIDTFPVEVDPDGILKVEIAY